MSNPYSEVTHSVEDLQQRETEETLDPRVIVAVDEIKDPIRTHRLPARELSMGNSTVADGPPVHILPDDVRRNRALLMPLCASGGTGTHVRFAPTSEEVQNGGGALWPARPPGSAPPAPLELNTSKGVWAMVDAGETNVVTVSYVAEYWAE